MWLAGCFSYSPEMKINVPDVLNLTFRIETSGCSHCQFWVIFASFVSTSHNTPNPKSLLTRRVHPWGIIVTYLDQTPFWGIPYYASISSDPWRQALWCRTAVTELQGYLQFTLSFAVSMYQGCQCLSRLAGTARLQIKSRDELSLSQVFGTPTARQLAGKKRTVDVSSSSSSPLAPTSLH